MMKRLKSSVAAWSCAFALSSFAILYNTVPYDRLLDIALSLTFGVSLAAVIRYSVDAFKAIRGGKLGAEFLIVAVFSMVLIILIQRTWGIALRVYDRPDWLVNSPVTIFLPWMLSWAISLALVAPDIDGDPPEARSGIWKSVALFIGGALAGFVLATSFKVSAFEVSQVSAWPQLANRAACLPDKPVWVSSNGIYHVSTSPYRGQVVAKWCLSSVEEAEKMGFRAPKGLKSPN